ncbi:hypothetical protein [Halobacillus sp. KGW1]|uniref:hypothetical protein n=1 Tax=Halobacillus sp. KGW1 TaxID=1793726 RepID=UPI0007844FB0|nr:hypothetical protein [Halobacillus sp. KGW1]
MKEKAMDQYTCISELCERTFFVRVDEDPSMCPHCGGAADFDFEVAVVVRKESEALKHGV